MRRFENGVWRSEGEELKLVQEYEEQGNNGMEFEIGPVLNTLRTVGTDAKLCTIFLTKFQKSIVHSTSR